MSYPTACCTSGISQSLLVKDFNGDGNLDLAAATYQGGVSLSLGNGDGTFQTSTFYAAGSNDSALVAVDLNNDGKPDLAIADGSSPGFITVLLNIAPAPAVSLSPTSLRFSGRFVGTRSTGISIKLSDSGTAPLLISSIALGGTYPGDYSETSNCGISLAVAASCSITIKFTPSAPGSRPASLLISDNALPGLQSVPLSGTGVAPVSLTTQITFNSQLVGATSAALNASLQNNLSTAVTISSITIAGANPGDFSYTTKCGTTLSKGSSCPISVRFSPTASGSRSATLLVSDSASNSPQTTTLTGTGFVPITLTPSACRSQRRARIR